MQRFTTTLLCIAILLINSVSAGVHTFEEVGLHLHTITESIEEDVSKESSSQEPVLSCYCADCFYAESSNSSSTLAIVALSEWLIPSIDEPYRYSDIFDILKRPIPPNKRPPILFATHS